MATSFRGETAKIYPFPAKGRAGADSKAVEPKLKLDRTQAAHTEFAGGGCWYHEAALHEADVWPQR